MKLMSADGMQWRLVMALALGAMVGCTTVNKGWVLKIDNSGADPIKNVTVKLADGRSQSSTEIQAGARSDAMSLGSRPPMGKIDLAWKAANGADMSQSVTITNRSDLKSGQIVLELKEGRPLRIFIRNEGGQFLGEIPWGNSADWDGTVSFPVNQE